MMVKTDTPMPTDRAEFVGLLLKLLLDTPKAKEWGLDTLEAWYAADPANHFQGLMNACVQIFMNRPTLLAEVTERMQQMMGIIQKLEGGSGTIQ